MPILLSDFASIYLLLLVNAPPGCQSQMDPRDPTGIAGLSGQVVTASSFRTNYVPLATQADFIAALGSSREFAAAAAASLKLDVFAYSIFHVFFEQYLDIGGQAVAMLGSAAAAVFIICLGATGSPWVSADPTTLLPAKTRSPAAAQRNRQSQFLIEPVAISCGNVLE